MDQSDAEPSSGQRRLWKRTRRTHDIGVGSQGFRDTWLILKYVEARSSDCRLDISRTTREGQELEA